MRDYMKTLLARFDSPSKRAAQLAEKVNQRRRQRAARLSKPERKLLRRLICQQLLLDALGQTEAGHETVQAGYIP